MRNPLSSFFRTTSTAATPENTTSRPLTILIVGNDHQIRHLAGEVAARILPTAQIIPYTLARSALFKVQGQKVDLLISNSDMLDMDELCLADAVRTINPFLPMIILSADNTLAGPGANDQNQFFVRKDRLQDLLPVAIRSMLHLNPPTQRELLAAS